MRKGILDEIDFVYPCSDDGTAYLTKGYPEYKNKVATKLLGTLDRGVKAYEWKDAPYEIVTCSNVVKVKRLDKLIRAMSFDQGCEHQMDALRGRTADGGYQSAGGKDAWRECHICL